MPKRPKSSKPDHHRKSRLHCLNEARLFMMLTPWFALAATGHRHGRNNRARGHQGAVLHLSPSRMGCHHANVHHEVKVLEYGGLQRKCRHASRQPHIQGETLEVPPNDLDVSRHCNPRLSAVSVSWIVFGITARLVASSYDRREIWFHPVLVWKDWRVCSAKRIFERVCG